MDRLGPAQHAGCRWPAAGRGPRLRTLAPTDPRGPKLLAEIDRRRKQAAERGGLVLPPWATRPTQTPLGLPVEWLSGFQRTRRAKILIRPSWRRIPAALPSLADWPCKGWDRARCRSIFARRAGKRHWPRGPTLPPPLCGGLGPGHRLDQRKGGQVDVEQESSTRPKLKQPPC